MQWGLTGAVSNKTTITFPLAFPNNLLVAVATSYMPTGTDSGGIASANMAQSGTLTTLTFSVAESRPTSFIVLGK